MANYNMRGVQFLTDHQGKKVAALVNLQEHEDFWKAVTEEYTERPFTFLVDAQGEKVAVVLDFENYGELWEDVYDSLAIEVAKDEPRIPWETVKLGLQKKAELSDQEDLDKQAELPTKENLQSLQKEEKILVNV